MKKILAILLCVIMLTVSVSAGTFIAGGGASLNMYNTNTKFSVDAVPITFMGYGIPLSKGVIGDLTPHEAYFIGQYSRVKVAGTENDFASIYGASLAGIWYLRDTMPKFQPFFLLRTDVDAQKFDSTTITQWTGQFGLGAGYPISENADVWAAASLKLGTYINSDIVLGLKFKF